MRKRASGMLSRARTYGATFGGRALMREVWARTLRSVTRRDTPSRFHIEISNTCNFSCEYCVLREQSTGDKLMQAETFEAILPHLEGASSVALSGLAEPLMHRRFSEYLARVRQVAPHAVISIDTNASLLTEQIAEDVVGSGLDSLVFSLDGTESELVDGIRQGGSLDAIISNIRVLNEVKQRHSSERPRLSATMVLQAKNLSQLPQVVRLASSLGVSSLSVNGLEPYESGLTGEALWAAPRDHTDSLAAAITEAAAAAAKGGLALRLPSLVPQDASCTQVERPIVLADGSVVPCSVLAYGRERHLLVDPDGLVRDANASTGRLSFGNVNDRPFEDIWRDPEYAEFRSAVLRSDFPAPCSSCLMKHNVICPNSPLTPEEFLEDLKGLSSGSVS